MYVIQRASAGLVVLRPTLQGHAFSVQLNRINLRLVAPRAMAVVEDRASLTSQLVAERAANRGRLTKQAAAQEAQLGAERREAAEAKKSSASEIQYLSSDNSTKVIIF